MKTKCWAQIWSKGAKISPETRFFYHFLKFGSLVFLEITYNDSLQKCLTCIRGENHENNFLGSKFGPKGQKLVSKLGFLPFSQVWFISFP